MKQYEIVYICDTEYGYDVRQQIREHKFEASSDEEALKLATDIWRSEIKPNHDGIIFCPGLRRILPWDPKE